MHWQKAVKEDAQDMRTCWVRDRKVWLHDRVDTGRDSSFSLLVREEEIPFPCKRSKEASPRMCRIALPAAREMEHASLVGIRT